jgi:tetrahedral aminopeptidase
MDILPFLKSLLSTSGISSYEEPVRELIRERWSPLVDEMRVSKLGSLEALKRGAGEGKRPSIMIATHMDAIGMLVTRVVDGFIYVTQVGGIDPRVVPGTPVKVFATGGAKVEELVGVIVMPSARLLPPSLGDGPIPLEHLVIDTGLLPKEVEKLVRVGDVVSYDTQPTELAGGVISGHTLDNRASVAALTVTLEELQGKKHLWDVWAVATTQEEVGLKGAMTSAFGIRPDLAIAVDVTFAKGPGASDWQTQALGGGVPVAIGPNFHPFLSKELKELAEKLEIPASNDPNPRIPGTDGAATQMTAEGIPTILLSIPLRYMHTPVEMVSVKDIQRTGRLMAEFITRLEADYMDKIVWDD